jgi:hypothetical protein
VRDFVDHVIGMVLSRLRRSSDRRTAEGNLTMREDEIRGSRLRRASRMTGAAAGAAARETAARVLSTRGNGASDRQRLKTAQALVRVLSGMRGAAMKVG